MLLSDLGPNHGKARFETVGNGTQKVTVTLADLGLTHARYAAKDVWNGNVTTVTSRGSLSVLLDDGSSQFLRFDPREIDSW